jgi:hypothetical protein
LFLLAACGSSKTQPPVADGGVAVPSTPLAIENLCPAMVNGLCHYLMTCSGERYQSLEQCTAETDCPGVGELAAAVQSGAVSYDAAKAGQCYARFMSDPCDFAWFWWVPTIFEVFAACPGTVTPRQGAGQPCVSSYQCTGDLYCEKGAGMVCPGKCTAYGQPGEPCSDTRLCATGLDCTGGTCQLSRPIAKAGDPCQSSSDCNWGSINCKKDEICDGNIWCDLSVKQCKPGVPEGGTCGMITGTGSGTTYYPTCAINLWCDSLSMLGTGKCRRKSAQGGPCTLMSACESGLHCDGYVSSGASATLGTCVGPAGPGGYCSGSPDCQTGLVCRSQKCSDPGSVGDTCTWDPDCAGGLFCNEGKCATAHYPGSSCNDTDAFCAKSRCAAGVCTRHKVVGESCASADECTSGSCPPSSGKCFDDSLCAP